MPHTSIVRWLYAIVAKHLVNRYCSKDCVTQAKTRPPHSITVYAGRPVSAEFFTRSKKGDHCRKREKERCHIYIRIHSHCNQLRCIWWFSFDPFFNRVLLWLKFCTGIVISLSRHFGTTSRSLYLRVSLNILNVFLNSFNFIFQTIPICFISYKPRVSLHFK